VSSVGLALAVDLGTGAVKAAVFEPGLAKPLALSSTPYLVPADPAHPERAQVDTAAWRSAAAAAIVSLPASLRRSVAAIGLTGLFPALVPLDADGSALAPAILYCDRRSVAQVERLRADRTAQLIERIGGSVLTCGTTSLTSWLWLREHEPEIAQAARWYGHASTLMGAWLTGEVAMDRSNAAMSGLLDSAGGEWSAEVADAVRVDLALLPRLVSGVEPVGRLLPEAAGELGLPTGTPVALTGGDTAAAAVGAACLEPGQCFISSGTTDTICLCLNRYGFDPRLFSTVHPLPRRWLSMAPTTYTGGSVEWAARLLYGDPAVAPLLADAEVVPVGAGGLVFVPYLMGERSPVNDPLARGVLAGMTPETERRHVARAVIDGSSLAIRSCVDALAEANGTRPESITIVGRPASSALLNRSRAAACGVPVRALAFEEGTLLGAAACGAVAGGLVRATDEVTEPFVATADTVEPDLSEAEAYDRLYPLYRDTYRCLAGAGLFARLGQV